MQERPRLRREQLRDLVISAGLELLLEDGLAGGTLPIGYADVFRWLETHRDLSISRAQVHGRIWSSLEEYRQDVLIALLDYRPTATLQATARSLGQLLRDATTDSPFDRRQLLIELTRAGVEANTSASRADPHTVVVEAVWAMHAFRAGGSNEPSNEISAAVQRNHDQALEAFLGLYRTICTTLGIDLGQRWGIAHEEGLQILAELLYSANNGAAGRATIEPELQTIPCGDLMWSIESLTAAAIVAQMASFAAPPRAPVTAPSGPEPRDPLDFFEPREPLEPSAPAARLSRQQLRSEMISAGVAWMLEKGFGHGAEHITYARVFERLEAEHGVSVSRAQVHGRVWESQDDFQLAVICEAARHRISPLISDLTEDVSVLLASFDLTRPGESERAVTEIARRRGPGTIAGMIASSEWLVAEALASFHGTNPSKPEQVSDALHESYVANIEEWTHFYILFAEVFAYEAQPWTNRSTADVCGVLARCAAAFTEGVAGRVRLKATPPRYQLRVGGGLAAEWDLTGIGNWCLIRFLLAPVDPDPPG